MVVGRGGLRVQRVLQVRLHGKELLVQCLGALGRLGGYRAKQLGLLGQVFQERGRRANALAEQLLHQPGLARIVAVFGQRLSHALQGHRRVELEGQRVAGDHAHCTVNIEDDRNLHRTTPRA